MNEYEVVVVSGRNDDHIRIDRSWMIEYASISYLCEHIQILETNF